MQRAKCITVVHFCGFSKMGLQNRWKSLFYAIPATLGCGNVLRGLSNKCLMRGTFRAICVFGVFHVFFEKTQKHTFTCLSRKSKTKNRVVFKNTDFGKWVKIGFFSCGWKTRIWGQIPGDFPVFVSQIIESSLFDDSPIIESMNSMIHQHSHH